MRQWIITVVVAFISYYLFAKVGLLFAIPPGFASAIWPAAGIALAVFLIRGPWALLGIFFASTLANFQVGGHPTDGFLWSSLFVPSLLAAGTCLQLIISRFLAYRFCEIPLQSAALKELVKFLLIVGPISCVIASGVGASVLALSNAIPMEKALFIWLTWWVGDFIGVMFFAPLVFLLVDNSFLSKNKHKWEIIIPSLLLFILVSFVFSLSRNQFTQSKHQEFVRSTNNFVQELSLIENTVSQQLLAMSALFNSHDVSREQFKTFSEGIMSKHFTLRGLGWVEYVADHQRENFVNTMQQQGINEYKIKRLDNGKFIKSELQDYYLPITYLEPQQANRAALGLDLSSHPVVKKTVLQAVISGDMTMSPQLTLVQQQKKFNGLVVYYPVYENLAQDPGYDNLKGLVEVVIELDVMVNSIFKELNQSDFHFRLVTNKFTQVPVSDTGYADSAAFHHTGTFPLFNSAFIVEFSSTSKFDNESVDWSSWNTIIAGSIVSTFSLFFIILVSNFNSHLEYQVKLQTRKLTNINKKLSKASDAKSRFLANMSHEYRTPLNAIVGFSQLGKQGSNDPQSADYFSKIQDASSLLLGIINDVLDFSKISEGKLVLEMTVFNLQQQLQSVVNLLAKKAEVKGIELNFNYDATSELYLRGDQTRLKQILVNIADNAIKFTEQGSVDLNLTVIKSDQQMLWLAINVTDTGIGIEQDKLSILFNSFTQADESTTRRFGGTGLGLAISKQLAELMGGEITVTSELGQGTEFHIELPFYIADKPNIVINNATTQSSLDFTGRTALIVEDNKINQLVAQKQLKTFNLATEVADNGQDALNKLLKHKPDMIFLDLHMPVMDGFTMLQKLITLPDYKDIPVVIISASVTKEDKQKAHRLGVEDYVTKPFTQEDLAKVLVKFLYQ